RSMEPIIERASPVLKNRFQPSKIGSSLRDFSEPITGVDVS
uniref:Uncharacterized protein n=1 Tax=Parascaris univalens TaxID=6257 RepID=A0A915AVI5_PARUN